MCIECSSCYLVGYLSHWYLIGLFVVDLTLILRHREDCSIVTMVKLVMVNLGQQVLEVLSLGSNNRIGSIQTGAKGKAIESLDAELGKESELHCLLLQISLLARLLLLRKDRRVKLF